MNAFEKKVSDEYNRNHALALLEEASRIAAENSDVIDPKQFQDHQMAILARDRHIYLALKEYHASLARYMKAQGIELPEFDILVSESPVQ